MWLLDTDHLSILERGGSTALVLQMRLGRVLPEQLASTIISYEEQMRGWTSHLAQAKSPQRLIEAYDYLQKHINTFRDIPLLAYDERAADEYERLRQARVRIGTKDARIDAICLANDVTLLACNLKDFNKVPGLRAEDWSV